MPRKKNADLVGRVDCPECGSRSAVYQSVKSYLYVRCPECGCDQRNGAVVQARLWQTMERVEGAQVSRPVNVPEDVQPSAAAVLMPPVGRRQKQEARGVPLGGLALLALCVGGFVKLVMS